MVSPPPSDPLSELTAREREILSLIAAGLSTAQIADRLHRSQRTIETHRHALGRKLGARNRVELTHIAIRAGLYDAASSDDLHFDLKRYREALDAGQAGCWDWNLDDNVVTINKTLSDLVGAQTDQPAPTGTFRPNVHEEDRERTRKAVEDHLAGRTEVIQIRYRYRHPDGRVLHMLSTGRAIREEDGRATRITGITMLVGEP